MDTHPTLRPLTYLLLAIGVLLAFISALVPHFNAGYQLLADVFLIGLLPYLILGLMLPYLRGWKLLLPVLLVVVVHAGLVAVQRFVSADPADSTNLIYFGAVVIAAALSALLVLVLRHRPRGGDGKPQRARRPPVG